MSEEEKKDAEKTSQELARERTIKAKKRSKLAADRTDYAEDRTLLANERTFAGWAKAAFASIGLGLGFQAFFQKVEPTWVPKGIATLFILLGMLLIWLAERRADGLLTERTGNHVKLMSRKMFRIMAIAVSLGGVALILCIWLLI